MHEIKPKNIEKSKWYHCNYRIIGMALCGILIILIVGNAYIYHLISKDKIDSTEIISSILTNAAKEKSLIPDIIVLGSKNDSLIKRDTSLKKHLLKFLSEKYAKRSSAENMELDIQPYLNSSDIKDEEKIINHIEYLSKTVINAVEDSKRNIDTEMSKINTWVTIWIGVIGFLGIFFPIIINLKSLDELKTIKSTSRDAKNNADHAKDMLEKYKTNLEKLPQTMSSFSGFEDKINEQSNRLDKLNVLFTSTEEKTQNIERLLKTLNIISKLKDIDGTFLMYNKNPLNVLIVYFEEIFNELSGEPIEYEHPLTLDILRQLASRLYTLSPYPFVSKKNMNLFNETSTYINNGLTGKITKDTFREILQKIQFLITSLKQP